MKRGARILLSVVLSVFVLGQVVFSIDGLSSSTQAVEAAPPATKLYGTFPDYGAQCFLTDADGNHKQFGGRDFCSSTYDVLNNYKLAQKLGSMPTTTQKEIDDKKVAQLKLDNAAYYLQKGFFGNQDIPGHPDLEAISLQGEWMHSQIQQGIKTPTIIMWLAWSRLSYPVPEIDSTQSSTNKYYIVKDGKLALSSEVIASTGADIEYRLVSECGGAPANSGVGMYECFNKYRRDLKKNLETLHEVLTVAQIESPGRTGAKGGDKWYGTNFPNPLLKGVSPRGAIDKARWNKEFDRESDVGGTIDFGGTNGIYDGEQFMSFADFAKYYYTEPFTSDLAKKITDLGGGENVGMKKVERCGNVAFSETFTAKNMKHIFCVLVDSLTPTIVLFMQSSGAFLGTTAGIPSRAVPNSALSWLAGAPVGGDITVQLDPKTDSEKAKIGGVIRRAHDSVLGLLNGILIFFFIIIALANILQIQVDAYSIKKTLPAIVIGFLLSNVSFFAIRAAIEISGAVSLGIVKINVNSGDKNTLEDGASADMFVDAFTKVAYGGNDASVISLLTDSVNTDEADPGKVLQQILFNLAVLVGGVLLFILGFLFMTRSLVLYFLIPLAPLAAFGINFPPLAGLWKKWYSTFSSWLFMPVVAFFWIWLASIWFKANIFGTDFFASVMAYGFGIVALFFAVKTPFTMAGEAKQLVDGWNKAGKSAWKNTGGQVTKGAGVLAKRPGVLAKRQAGVVFDKSKIGAYVREKKEEEAKSIERAKTINATGVDPRNVKKFAKEKVGLEEDLKIAQADGNVLEIEKIEKKIAELGNRRVFGVFRKYGNSVLNAEKQIKQHLEKKNSDADKQMFESDAELRLATHDEEYRHLDEKLQTVETAAKNSASRVKRVNRKNYRGESDDVAKQKISDARNLAVLRQEAEEASFEDDQKNDLRFARQRIVNQSGGVSPTKAIGESDAAFNTRKELYSRVKLDTHIDEQELARKLGEVTIDDVKMIDLHKRIFNKRLDPTIDTTRAGLKDVRVATAQLLSLETQLVRKSDRAGVIAAANELKKIDGLNPELIDIIDEAQNGDDQGLAKAIGAFGATPFGKRIREIKGEANKAFHN